jgi:carboxyl-terminal processing protease
MAMVILQTTIEVRFSLIANKQFYTYTNMNYKNVLTALLGAVLLVTACKKKDLTGDLTPPPPVDVVSKLKDSVLLYSRDIYLWYAQIPSTFNAQKYEDPDKIMTAIRAFSTEPGFSQPVDRWSFAYKQKDWDNVSSGISQDFGLNIFFLAEGDLRVRYVEKASPAGLAGIKRGWQLTKINGSTNITTSNAEFIVKAVYQSASGNFTFKKPDGTSTDINLTAASYQEHPVLLDSVYTVNGKQAGYLAFNSFLGDTTEIYNRFQQVFNRFAQQNVEDVVIDLRYNGGGYVTVQQKLANYLINSAGNGQLMMKEQFNDKYSQFNELTNFNKLGPLNLSRIFFIVSNSTASASELLINNLKPYMNVLLVGPSDTYGKPVGFFPIPVEDWYIFPVSFRSTNKNGEGNYFKGLGVDSKVGDGLDKDWGDTNELALARALKYIATGAFRARTDTRATPYTPDPLVVKGNQVLDIPNFKGTIGTQKVF